MTIERNCPITQVLALCVTVAACGVEESPVVTEQTAAQSTPGGCYLRVVSGAQIVGESRIGSASLADCKSMALAQRYGVPNDFRRLAARTAAPPMTAAMEAALKGQLPGASVRFYRRTSLQALMGQDGTLIQVSAFPLTKCATVSFFGIKLHCFNAVLLSGKPNNMAVAIRPLLFLKLLNNKSVYHSILGAYLDPFDLMVQEEAEFVDATDANEFTPAFVSSEFGGVTLSKCQGDGTAHFEFRWTDDPARVASLRDLISRDFRGLYSDPIPLDVRRVAFVCKKTATQGAEGKIEAAGIYYHELNHRFGTHGEFIANPFQSISSPKTAPSCVPLPPNLACDDAGVRCKEWDLISVYGVHARLLFEMSGHPGLSVKERCMLYEAGQKVRYWPGTTNQRFCGNPTFSAPNPCP